MKREFIDLQIEIVVTDNIDVITESLVGWWIEDQDPENINA